MSSIRLYILSALVEHGPMHGHQLRQVAEQEHVQRWSDISVGSLYGAMKRLAADGLITEIRTEREGNYPERQVFGITGAGIAALARLRHDGLATIEIRPDPFVLAFARQDPTAIDPRVLDERLSGLRSMLADVEAGNVEADPHVTLGERWALGHRAHRLRAEIDWLESLIAALPAIVADARSTATRAP